eukprot:scaffold601635_cov18-Prasinocladus_malaysianus.AAC.1
MTINAASNKSCSIFWLIIRDRIFTTTLLQARRLQPADSQGFWVQYKPRLTARLPPKTSVV